MTGGFFGPQRTAMQACAALVISFAVSSIASGQTLTGTGPDGNELTALGDLPGGAFSSVASAVSGDGTVVIGGSSSAGIGEAFRWTQSGGMVGLGDLPGGSFFSTAVDTNSDGSVVVGYSTSGSGREAFRWTQGTGLVNIGDLAGGATFGEAWGRKCRRSDCCGPRCLRKWF